MMRFLALGWGLLGLVMAARGGDWPEFRGPTGEGIASEEKLPLHWGPKRNIAWKQAIPGSGWSSPVVAGKRVYLTTSIRDTGKDQGGGFSLRALCLDAGSGKILWSREVFHPDAAGTPPIHAKNSHASPTPLVHGQRLFVHFGHQGTACLDLDGKIVWRNDSLRYAPVHGNGGSPILVDDLLVFSCDGASDPFIVALDAQTGKVRWKTPRNNQTDRYFSFSTPLVITVAGHKQIISPASGLVAAYDPASGREIWRVRHHGYSVIPRPVYGHGLVYISTGYDSPVLLAIRPDGEGDVTDTHIAWQTRRNAPNTPSLLLDGDELYMVSDHGVASCLDARSGKVHWLHRLGGDFSASPLLAGKRIYCLGEQGVTTVLAAGKQLKELARNDLKERSLASIAAADGALFLRTDRHLYRIQDPD